MGAKTTPEMYEIFFFSMKAGAIISSQKQRQQAKSDNIQIHQNTKDFVHNLCWVN
jgi:hypothetical protein